MYHAIIFADNKYQPNRLGILRAPGAHRIATLLRSKKIQTEVVDFYLDWTLDEIKQLIDYQLTKPTLFIGFSCSLMFEGTVDFKQVRDYIKSKNPNVSIVVGGFGTTQKGFDGADYYVEGYGEYAIIALIDHLQDPTKELKYDLDNGNKIIYTKDHYPVNKLTTLETVYSESDFIDHSESLSIETARGCVFKCKFCNFQLLGKSKLDYLRDPKEIEDEMLENYKKYGTTKYIVTEDTFNDTDEKVNMLYEISQRLPFQPEYMGYVRADLLAAKPHNIKKLVDSGFTSMHFGIETFNEHAAKIIGKGMPAKKLKETLINLKKEYPQVYTNGTFIIGLPGESESEIKETAQWILDSKTIDFWTFNPLMIPKQHKYFYTSEFSNNYLMYGYQHMTSKEIEISDSEKSDLIFASKVRDYIIMWKNKHFNYFTATNLAHDLNQIANPYKKVDAWTTFAISSVGFDVKEVQKHTYTGENPLDQQSIIELSNKFITMYKQRKLDWLKNN